MNSKRICIVIAIAVSSYAFMGMGCAASEPSREELHKGAYRPVRAPVFNPTTDAPHTFRPVQPSPVQPGPVPSRVLPQTPETRREPGIWSSAEPERTVHLLWVQLPFAPEVRTELDQAVTTGKCAIDMGGAVLAARMDDAVRRLDKDVRACLAAELYFHCARGTVQELERQKREALDYDAGLLGIFSATLKTASGFRDSTCTNAMKTKAFRDMLKTILSRWAEDYEVQ